MKSSIKALLVVMAITGAAGAGLAHAFPPGSAQNCMHGPQSMGFAGHDGYGDPERRIDRMADVLNLTKVQRDSMRAIVDKARPQTRELSDKLTENHKQLHALMQQDAPKENEVRQLAEAQGRVMAEMIVLRTKVQTEIRGVLTDVQREQLLQWHKERGQHLRRDQSFSSEKEGTAHDLSGAATPIPPASRVSMIMM